MMSPTSQRIGGAELSPQYDEQNQTLVGQQMAGLVRFGENYTGGMYDDHEPFVNEIYKEETGNEKSQRRF